MSLMLFSASYLISCGHYGHHREFLDLHLCDAHSGQEADLRGAHVGPFSQHALPALDVVTDGPEVGGERMKKGKIFESSKSLKLLLCIFGTWSHNAGHKSTQCTNLMSCPGRACTRIRTSSSSVP